MSARVDPDRDISKASWREDGYDDGSVFLVLRVNEAAALAEGPAVGAEQGRGAARGSPLFDFPPRAPDPRPPVSPTLIDDSPPYTKPDSSPAASVPIAPAVKPLPFIAPPKSAPRDDPGGAPPAPAIPEIAPVISSRPWEPEPAAADEPPARPSYSAGSAPPIAAPACVSERGERCWMPRESSRSIQADCYSHRGPHWTWRDKENEDFAFAAICTSRDGEPWVLAGVCDGVSNSTWGERGAKLAAASFITVVGERLSEGWALDEQIQSPAGKRSFAADFHQHTKRLLESDARLLFEGRHLHPSWKDDLYERTFLVGKNAALRRTEWLQTTLLATALGPRGGFALLLGDGFVRVDRHRSGQDVRRKVIPLQSDERSPERRISLALTAEEVEQSLRGVPRDHSARIAMILATDGVSKSPRHGLDDSSFEGSGRCQSFLDALARRPKGDVESDNMSIAFASRETS